MDTKSENGIEYSIVIPVYNSEKSLNELHERLTKVFNSISPDYEIILIDDNSKDNSWNEIEDLHTRDKKVKIIQFSRNFGQNNAVMCGFIHSKGEYVITMDDDLQHPPEEIPKLIDAIKNNENSDVIIGIPKKKKHNIFRNFVSSVGNLINSFIFKKPLKLRMGSFRIIRRRVINEMIKNQSPNIVMGPLILSTTSHVKNTTVEHHKRKEGKSNYKFINIFKMSLDNILTNSTLPLRIVSIFGIIISFVNAGIGIFFILRYLIQGIETDGWASTIVIIVSLLGVVLFSLGIIGEYLIRIIDATHFNQQFVIRNKKM